MKMVTRKFVFPSCLDIETYRWAESHSPGFASRKQKTDQGNCSYWTTDSWVNVVHCSVLSFGCSLEHDEVH